MNAGQEKFFDFILKRVQEGKEDEVRALLAESFSKQEGGTFDTEYLTAFMPRLVALLKPEFVEEVQGIMNQFGNSHVSK